MTLPRVLLATVTMMGAATSAHAASFDCRKASTPIEGLICADPQSSSLDEQIAARYNYLAGTISAADKKTLKADQLSWLKYVRN